MFRFSGFSSGTAALLLFGMTASTVAPLVISVPANAATFSDVNNHWARPFIEALAEAKIVNGFPDGTFKPNQAVTRAEFATLVQAAFRSQDIRESRKFNDVPNKYWASPAIEKAYSSGFMSGYPNNMFRPQEKIPRVQALVSLANGLNLKNNSDTQTVLNVYRDSNEIPQYAVDPVAAATAKNLVVNYPNVNFLNPNKVATRADVAAFIYQAKTNLGELPPIDGQLSASNYIVGGASSENPSLTQKLPKGSKINVSYTPSQRVVVTPGETLNMTLMVANDIKNSQGEVLIPKNSQIEGQLVPRYSGNDFKGSQFVAQKLMIGNKSYNTINASSALINAEQPTNVIGSTLQNTAMTVAAQAVLAKITGQQINVGDILSSVLMGQARDNKPQDKDKLIIIEPQKDLNLTLDSDFYVNTVASVQR
ncbi:MAG: S-layer homology domain-containing protein [Cyanobacteriota bacterium]